MTHTDPTIKLSDDETEFIITTVDHNNLSFSAHIPIGLDGLIALVQFLSNHKAKQESAKNVQVRKTVTQEHIDKYLKNNTVTTVETIAMAKAQKKLEEMGLGDFDLDELDL